MIAFYTPYSKMAIIIFSVLLFPCKLALVASFLNSRFKKYIPLNKATRANLQGNKRILKWQPFWNKAYNYRSLVQSVSIRA